MTRAKLPKWLAAVTTSALACSALVLVQGTASAETVAVGAGSYTTELPAGALGPSSQQGQPVSPKVTDAFTGAAPTNDWWSSLIFQRYAPDNPHGENMFPHPLAFKAQNNGLAVGYPSSPNIVGTAPKYEYSFQQDLRLGLSGLSSPDTKVDSYSDWTVTPFWGDGTRELRTTIGHGLPFVYAEGNGGPAEVEFSAPPEIFHQEGGVLGATVNGNHYALFAPSSSSWTASGNTFTSDLGGDGYFSVAVLPDPADLSTFQNYAYSFVTGTTVNWDYDEAGASVTTDFQVQTEAKEGSETGTLLALYPHQWKNVTNELTDLSYASPRGEMRVVEGGGFSTELPAGGIMPSLPTVDSADHDRLRQLIDEEINHEDPWRGATDTYWVGKALGRLSQLVPIADSIGYTEGRDALLELVRGKMEDWLTFSGPGDQALFRYDENWGALTGYPSSFGADQELNDHDFHYGYFVTAAATLARYDAAWASDEQWGGMVKMVIKDANNWDRTDDRFPLLRSFSPYAGHGWASGHAGFGSGNNQESSSEGMHFAGAVAMFGSITGDDDIRDLGVYMHSTQASTVAPYWQNADGDTFPDSYDADVVGMVWSDGGDYGIWWDGSDEEHYGINYLPITASSLYHGTRPDHVNAMHQSLVDRIGGQPQVWRDIHWAYQAMGDPDAALAAFDGQWQTYEPEAGSSKAHTYQWVSTLAEVGTVDAEVTSDAAHYAVFDDAGQRTYTAFNPDDTARTVNFSDGTTLEVPARGLASTAGS
ncbi:glycosyl hydrolase [Actinoalloteichus hymeniacidonis]|uniref:glucan endo-1,3-beta-D-glucosidase n=1 Tax=Actinoalloteichus hymeniacidonis TaxID=340345 RepID=A0AAC9HU14_9PSEU|nr:glycosyl hydrolase [Actinoalloteichus hymeniacidonis]AOS65111.1 putative glycosyl hydrolase [Actinoalloteichus hymeniacidonis]MBB5906810.1 endoglucanase Acf2 [Actinoalloteichus hymeniacidonis]